MYFSSEAPVRRAQVPELTTLEKQLSQALGGATIRRDANHSIVRAIDWLKTLIVR